VNLIVLQLMKELFAFIMNSNLYYHLYNSLPLDPTLNHMNSIQFNSIQFKQTSFKVLYNIILRVPRYFKGY